MTSSYLHILLVAVAAYFMFWIIGRAPGLKSADKARMYAPPPPPAVLSTAMPVEQWPLQAARELELHLHQGKIIDAVELYGEYTGVGLKDAKGAVKSISDSRLRY